MGGDSAPMPYTPANQAGADASYTSNLNALTAADQATLGTASTGYNQAYQQQINSPYAAQAQAGANTAGANAYAAGTTDVANAQQLGSYAPALMQSGFDPQSAMYNQQLKGAQDAQSVANAQSGVAGSPFGAGMVGDAAQQFNLNWQASQAQRQQQAIAALASLYENQQQLAATGAQNQAAGAALPQQTYTDINNQNISALNSLVTGMGNASAPLVNDMNAAGNYLNIGQNSTKVADQATQQNNTQGGIMGSLGTVFSIAKDYATAGAGA